MEEINESNFIRNVFGNGENKLSLSSFPPFSSNEEMLNEWFSYVKLVDDKDKRLYFESRIISTISHCEECKPSENWLGNSSPKEKIRKSGLWLVNELWKTSLNDEDMRELEKTLKIK